MFKRAEKDKSKIGEAPELKYHPTHYVLPEDGTETVAVKPTVKRDNQLTVKQLIEILSKLPQDAIVWTEGCDCYGIASDALIQDDHVMIFRGDES